MFFFLLKSQDNKCLPAGVLKDLIIKQDEQRKQLHKKLNVSWLRSKVPWLMYPLAMFLLISITAFTCAIVLFNLLNILFNFDYSREDPFVLGIRSISKMGIMGALVQTLLIVYIWCASLVGLYALPVLGLLRPLAGKTPFFKIMLNCMVVLILSSALPLFTRTVGITNFELFGNFGQIVWTQDYHLVLVYNCAFLVALIICLCHNIVVKLSKEFFSRVHNLFLYLNRLFKSVQQKLQTVREACIVKPDASIWSLLTTTSRTNNNITTTTTTPATTTTISTTTTDQNSSSSSVKSLVSSLFRNTLHSSIAFLYSVLHLRTVHSTSPIKEVKK